MPELHVSPGASGHDTPGSAGSYPELPADLGGADPAGVTLPHRDHILFGQLRVRFVGSAPAHVVNIIPWESDDDVCWVHAWWIIAGVPGDNMPWQFSVLQFRDDTMRVTHLAVVAGATISSVVDVPLPFPTLIVGKATRGVSGDTFFAGLAVGGSLPDWRAEGRISVLDFSPSMGGAQSACRLALIATATHPTRFRHTANDTMEGR